MPKSVFKDGRVIICKTFDDVDKEFKPRIDAAFKKYQESLILNEEYPEKIEECRQAYKAVLLERDAEALKWEAILFGKDGVNG